MLTALIKHVNNMLHDLCIPNAFSFIYDIITTKYIWTWKWLPDQEIKFEKNMIGINLLNRQIV